MPRHRRRRDRRRLRQRRRRRAADPAPSAFARPKSSTFTVPSGRTLMFAGFRSRWMMPCSCAASSASAICLAIGSASSSGIAPLRDPLRQIVALDQLHHERRDAVGVLESVDGGDVRMIQRGEDFRFALEAGEPLGIGRERRREDLDRDLALQLRVRGAIDLAHAARADGDGDFVGAEAGAGGKGQGLL